MLSIFDAGGDGQPRVEHMSNGVTQCNAPDVSVVCDVTFCCSTEKFLILVKQSVDQMTTNIAVTEGPCEARRGRGNIMLRFINKSQKKVEHFRHLETFGDLWRPLDTQAGKQTGSQATKQQENQYIVVQSCIRMSTIVVFQSKLQMCVFALNKWGEASPFEKQIIQIGLEQHNICVVATQVR